MRTIDIDNYQIDYPITDILNDLKGQLSNGKLSQIYTKHDQIVVSCPNHKNGLEEHPSCSIYCGDSKDIGYGVCHCFTCDFSGPLWHFVGTCFDKDDYYGKKWLIENYGKKIELRKEKIKLPIIDLTKKQKTFLSEDILNNFIDFHPYMTKRKLKKDICEKFKVKYDKDTNCLVFPVWDINNNLVFLTRRNVDEKKFLIDKNADKSNIYLLNYVLKENHKTVIVVESQINALTLWQYGYPAVALFGAGTPIEQIETLNKTPIRHYILAYDNDNAGLKGTNTFLKNIRKDVLVDVVNLPLGKDINDLEKEDIDKLFIQYYN